jgi:hypothetical protein
MIAARLLPDKVTVLEIGVGTGKFRKIVQNRCIYEGADLAPLDIETFRMNLDTDDLPKKHYDYIVLLGVFEYLHSSAEAVRKICASCDNVITTYCCRSTGLVLEEITLRRSERVWVNAFSQQEFTDMFATNSFELNSCIEYNHADDFMQFVMNFRRVLD